MSSGMFDTFEHAVRAQRPKPGYDQRIRHQERKRGEVRGVSSDFLATNTSTGTSTDPLHNFQVSSPHLSRKEHNGRARVHNGNHVNRAPGVQVVVFNVIEDHGRGEF